MLTIFIIAACGAIVVMDLWVGYLAVQIRRPIIEIAVYLLTAILAVAVAYITFLNWWEPIANP